MKFKFLFTLAMFLVTVSLEAECIKGDCYNGNGILLKDNDYTYAGHFKNGKKDGKGVDKIGNSHSYRIYNGSFCNDQYNGEGILYIYNEHNNPYIFGSFKDGNLANNSEVLMKFENGVEAYYKITNTTQGKSNMQLMQKKTADLYCSKNPTNISCVNRLIWNNKEAIAALLAVGYISSVLNSNTRISFNDVSQGIKSLANSMDKRKNERAKEFADRLANRLGL